MKTVDVLKQKKETDAEKSIVKLVRQKEKENKRNKDRERKREKERKIEIE